MSLPPAGPSDLPVRPGGTRARSGNAMLRTRDAILRGAEECLATGGVRGTTMTDVATTSRVAKATLYNHFRTKDDLLAALVDARTTALAQECARTGELAAALGRAAEVLAASPVLRRLGEQEPAVLAGLVRPAASPRWDAVRAGVAEVLTACGHDAAPAAVDAVLRHLVGLLAFPSAGEDAALGARALAAALPAAGPAAEPGADSTAAPAGESAAGPGLVASAAAVPAPAGLGWPAR